MKKIHIYFFCIIIAILSSCSTDVDELRKACNEEAGWIVEESIKADGYYDMTTTCHHCWHDLISSPFKFVEFCDDDEHRKFKNKVLPDQGCFRLSKVLRATESCHQKIDDDLMKKAVEPYITFREEQCINVIELDNISSKYAYSTTTEERWLDKRKGVLLKKSYARINEVNTGDLTTEFISFSLVPGNAKTSKSKPSISCFSLIKEKDEKNKIWPAYQNFLRNAFAKQISNWGRSNNSVTFSGSKNH